MHRQDRASRTPFDVNAAIMQPERHGGGIHIESTQRNRRGPTARAARHPPG
jgi:hypothetical protein